MRIAVIGATGAVGRELLQLLERTTLPLTELVATASPRSAGRALPFGQQTLTVQATGPQLFEENEPFDLVFFCAGSSISRELVPKALEHGATVVDNSSAFRGDDDVPLVVPEVNVDALDTAPPRRLVANPNCTTAVLLTAIAPLHRAAGVRAIIAASYQAVSGSGSRGIAELEAQSRMLVGGNQGEVAARVYPHQIAFNILPHVDAFHPGEAGYSGEELKLRNESRKILGVAELKVSATCCRVPVFRSHAVAAHLHLERELSPDEARGLCESAPGVVVQDAPAEAVYPLPLERARKHEVAIGRIRRDEVFDPGLALWVVGDQLLKGAALNSLQIAEALHKRGHLTSNG